MLRLLFNRKHRKNLQKILALDIGTESVKALICTHEPDSKQIKVIGAGRQKQNLGDMQGGAILDIAAVIENCEYAIGAAEKEAGVSCEQMIMGIGGELIKGKSITVSYKRENPEKKINLTELKNIVHKVQWKAFDQIRKELVLETGHSQIEIKLVNAAITKVEIDGQPASNPIGFQGKDMTLHIFNAFAPLTHFGALQTVATELEMELLATVSQPYALARALTAEDGGDLSAIFVNVGGGKTDLAVVQNGAVLGMKTFSIGGRSFTKRIALGLNISYREADRIKIAYANRELDRTSSEIIREMMQADADVWIIGFELALREFQTHQLPSRVLLCGGGAKLPEIRHTLSDRKWAKKLHFTTLPRVQFLNTKDIESVLDTTGKLKDIDATASLALASLTRDFICEESMLQRIMRNMTSIISSKS